MIKQDSQFNHERGHIEYHSKGINYNSDTINSLIEKFKNGISSEISIINDTSSSDDEVRDAKKKIKTKFKSLDNDIYYILKKNGVDDIETKRDFYRDRAIKLLQKFDYKNHARWQEFEADLFSMVNGNINPKDYEFAVKSTNKFKLATNRHQSEDEKNASDKNSRKAIRDKDISKLVDSSQSVNSRINAIHDTSSKLYKDGFDEKNKSLDKPLSSKSKDYVNKDKNTRDSNKKYNDNRESIKALVSKAKSKMDFYNKLLEDSNLSYKEREDYKEILSKYKNEYDKYKKELDATPYK